MGNCCSHCGSKFRAVFKPNEDAGGGMVLKPTQPSKPDVLPKPPPTTDSTADVKALQVKNVDLCLSENGPAHHTERFNLMEREKDPRLVVRRGQPFVINLTFDRSYDTNKDGVSFIFKVADVDKPNHGQGSFVAVPLLPKESEPIAGWNAILDSTGENSIKVQITPAADAIVGQWKMEVDTKVVDDGAVSYSHPSNIYVLFNPWCKEDQVYMEKEDEREEYVLNDFGVLFRGTHNRIRPCPWNYGQFEEDVLDCSLYLLTHVGHLGVASRADAIRTVRAISAAVNSPDDDGALVGNWSGDYSGGTAPTQWIGSIKILQKYYKKKKPVKYGQCWVFSGVVTTICRALGIPSRSVTNFSSAHDTQSSLTIDYFLDDKGEIMEEMNEDSVWNFHVWNEAWMQRADLLPAQYGGWQAIDATPQEESDEMYRCGPASVVAVKEGEVLKAFDHAFVFSEVNADEVYWRYLGPWQPLKLLHKNPQRIGQFISTKAIGSDTRLDITDTYKYPDKSPEERAVMLRALRSSESSFSRYYLNEEFNDIHYEFELRDDIVIGSPFSVVVVIKNRNPNTDHNVTVQLRADTVLYTGRDKKVVKTEKAERLVKAGKVEEVRMDVSYDDYYNKLLDQCAFHISCLGTVQGTSYEYFALDDFRVRKPDIKIETEGDLVQGQEFSAKATFTNPLPIPLKKGLFVIEGPGLGDPLKLKLKENIPANEIVSTSFKLTPLVSGRRTIAAKFTSKELEDVDGALTIEVAPKKEINGTGNSA